MNERRNQPTMARETDEHDQREAQARDTAMREETRRGEATGGTTRSSGTETQQPAKAMSTAAMANAMEQRDNDGEQRTQTPTKERGAVTESRAKDDGRPTPLFPTDECDRFHNRWTEMQMGFVDEPRQSVEKADALVAEVIQRLAQVFAEERSRLEQQWAKGGDVDTEELRVALQRYRSFFERLLSA